MCNSSLFFFPSLPHFIFPFLFINESEMAPKQSFAQKITYDVALWLFNIMIDIFFREVRPRGAHKIPKKGPVIFVVAPHANQVGFHILPLFFCGKKTYIYFFVIVC